MNLSLVDQTAVVAGAAQGIGRAIAEAFAAEGCAVALLDIAPAVAEAAEQLAKRYAVHTRGQTVDVADYAGVQAARQEMEATLGPADHVAAAAAIGSNRYGFPFWNLSPRDWQTVLQVNLMGAVHVLHCFAPGMAQRRSGTFLLLSSVAGQIGSQTDPPYSAAKAALINFAQCAAKDLAPHNVRVNTICPGMVKTELNQSVYRAAQAHRPDSEPPLSYEQWAEAKIRDLAPLGRWQTAEEIAAMAVFLASRHAANITGQTINIDGGQVMHS